MVLSVCDARGEFRYTNAAYRSLLALEEDTDPSLLQLDNRFEWLAVRDLEGRLTAQRAVRDAAGAAGRTLVRHTHEWTSCAAPARGKTSSSMSAAHPFVMLSGQIVGGVVVFRDVTGRRKLEQQLQYSERKLRSLVESNIFGVIVSDCAGRIYEANDRFAQIVGYSKEELLSGAVTWQQLVPPDYQEAQAQAIKTLLSTGAMPP